MQTTDVLISGGGVAGLTAAAAFGSLGFSVICIEANPPVTSDAESGADLRTTAVLQPSIPVLQAAGLWQYLQAHAAPLQVMRIIDAGGPGPEPRVSKDFDAADLSDQPFGWNLPNWLLRKAMLARLDDLPNVSLRTGLTTTRLLTRTNAAIVTLSDGSRVSARLAIAADGRASTLRDALGIAVKTIRYGQKALSFTVTHKIPHGNVSTEIHRSGGPFTLVPLPDRDGSPASAVIWMETGPEAMRLSTLPIPDFEAAMNIRSCHALGPLVLSSRRTVWPIITQIAERMAGERVALLAEAAHVLPPIGAQGLNMSLSDLAALCDLARSDPADLGSARMLDAYHDARHRDIQARIIGIDALNRASMTGGQMLHDMRANALTALHSVEPLRKTLMRSGLGLR